MPIHANTSQFYSSDVPDNSGVVFVPSNIRNLFVDNYTPLASTVRIDPITGEISFVADSPAVESVPRTNSSFEFISPEHVTDFFPTKPFDVEKNVETVPGMEYYNASQVKLANDIGMYGTATLVEESPNVYVLYTPKHVMDALCLKNEYIGYQLGDRPIYVYIPGVGYLKWQDIEFETSPNLEGTNSDVDDLTRIYLTPTLNSLISSLKGDRKLEPLSLIDPSKLDLSTWKYGIYDPISGKNHILEYRFSKEESMYFQESKTNAFAKPGFSGSGVLILNPDTLEPTGYVIGTIFDTQYITEQEKASERGSLVSVKSVTNDMSDVVNPGSSIHYDWALKQENPVCFSGNSKINYYSSPYGLVLEQYDITNTDCHTEGVPEGNNGTYRAYLWEKAP